MGPTDSLYPADWLRIAETDLSRVGRLLGIGDPAAAGFYLQQAVEKFLKAFLLAHGWELKRIHDLEALLNAALPHDPSLESFRQICQRITLYYMVERYPFTAPSGVNDEDIRESLGEAERLIGKLLDATGG